MNTLGSRLKAARTANSLTQAEVSRRSGVKQSDISKLENGSVAGSTKVVQLALAAGCDPRWLATGEGAPSFFAPGEFDHLSFEHLAGTPIQVEVRGASQFLEGHTEIDADDPSVRGAIVGTTVNVGYAIKVRGDRHAPALKDGQFVVIEAEPAAPGDLGLFTLKDGRVLLRELLRETADAYHVDLPAWGARQTLPKSDVATTEHIVAVVSPNRWAPFDTV